MSPEARFWSWFTEQEDSLSEAPAEVFEARVNRRLKLICPGLACQVRGEPGGSRTLILTAHGVLQYFPFVESVAAAAPILKHFRVTAFTPAQPGLAHNQDIRFQPATDGERAGLTLFVNDYSEERQDVLSTQLCGLLSALLGEYDMETKVGFVDVKAMPEQPGALRKLEELPLALGSFPPRT